MVTTPTFDYLPPGILPITDDAVEAAIRTVTDQGMTAAAWDVMLDAQVDQFRRRDEFADRLREVYREAGVDLISPTVWSTDPRTGFAEGVYRDLARWQARFSILPWMQPVRTPEEARRVADAGDVGVLLNVQNLGAFTEGESGRVEALYNAGVRIAQLTYNKQNAIGAGCIEPEGLGLTTHGRRTVERLNDLGCVVDLSHCGRRPSKR